MLDVSALQREVDWKKVRAGGFSGVMVKASQGKSEYTKGLADFEDSRFAENVRGAKAAGLRVGAYHYLTAQNRTEAEREAEFFCSVLARDGRGLSLWAAADVESRFLPENRERLTEVVTVFCEAVRKKGYSPMVYTNPDFLRNRLGDISRYPLWLANWLSGTVRTAPPSDGECAAMKRRYPAAVVWQWGLYAGGSVPGINGTADGDILLSAYPSSKPQETKKQETKTVRAGCTVRVRETVTENGRRCARCWGGGYFRVWYDTYTVTSLSGGRAVIERDGVIAAAVPVEILEAV